MPNQPVLNVQLEPTSASNVNDDLVGEHIPTAESDSIPQIGGNSLGDSIENICSDQWSNRGVSSKVSITIDTGDVANLIEEKETPNANKNCFTRCVKKLVGNVLLPGLVGVYSYRQIDKLPHTHPISKQLVTNVLYYCSRVRAFIRQDLLPEMKSLATEIYFPTGQIEADGLSSISAEIWAATYLLLSTHRHIREADFHNIRSAYTSLTWDSSQTYRATLTFHRCLEAFRSKILPLWFNIEDIAGLDLKNEFSAIDHPSRPIGKSSKKRRNFWKGGRPASSPLPTIQLHGNLILQHTLSLQIIREKKSEKSSGKDKQQDFSKVGYGRQLEVIKSLLGKPIDVLHSAPTVYKLIEPKLLSGKLNRPNPCEIASYKKALGYDPLVDNDLTCSRAMKILIANLKILFEEVDMPPSISSDIMESVSSLGEELNDFLGYSEWTANKFSEFHSMLKLCYNFALMCFDMDLPSFGTVVEQELAAEDVYALDNYGSSGMLTRNSNRSVTSLNEDRLEYKVVSLTKLMMEASASSVRAHKQHLDDDFDWQDFYKTQYHGVLQRLPLRVGSHLLQFSSRPEAMMIVRRRFENGMPNNNMEDLQRFPGSFSNIKRLNI